MTLAEEFAAAQQRVQRLARRPAAGELLALYALYKQATAGDVSGKRPGMLDLKGRAKYDAWASRRGQAADACMREYVSLVADLQHNYGSG